METPETTLKKMNIPSDCGTSIVFDFQFNKLSGSPEEQGEMRKKVAAFLKQFLAVHFEKELRNNDQFAGKMLYSLSKYY